MEQWYVDLRESSCLQCEDWAMIFSAIYGSIFFVLMCRGRGEEPEGPRISPISIKILTV